MAPETADVRPVLGTPASTHYDYRGIITGSAEGVSLDEILFELSRIVHAQGQEIGRLRAQIEHLDAVLLAQEGG